MFLRQALVAKYIPATLQKHRSTKINTHKDWRKKGDKDSKVLHNTLQVSFS